MNSDGIGGVIKAGAWLSKLLDLVLGCGRAGDAPAHSGKLELSGRFLAYDITLDGGWIFVSAAVMDRGDPPECLLTIADNAENWRTVCQLITALERSAIRERTAPAAGDWTARTELLGYRMTTAAKKRKSRRREKAELKGSPRFRQAQARSKKARLPSGPTGRDEILSAISAISAL